MVNVCCENIQLGCLVHYTGQVSDDESVEHTEPAVRSNSCKYVCPMSHSVLKSRKHCSNSMSNVCLILQKFTLVLVIRLYSHVVYLYDLISVYCHLRN